MRRTTLITGASSGIGTACARLCAAEGEDLVLVARREWALQDVARELRAAHGVEVTVVAADLTEPDAPSRLHAAVPRVDMLINNAGFGGHGPFTDQNLARQRRMIELNVEALTALCHLYLPGMIATGRGRILNVSSTASFLPGPQMAVYFATKAYVTSFSQALAEEVRGTGVTVTVLCPGPVSTEFGAQAGMDGLALLDQAVTPDHTARRGLEAARRGRLVAFDDRRLGLILGWVVPLFPRRLVLWASRKAMEKR